MKKEGEGPHPYILWKTSLCDEQPSQHNYKHLVKFFPPRKKKVHFSPFLGISLETIFAG